MNIKMVYYLIQLLEGLGIGAFFPIYTPWLELHGLNFFKMGYVNFIYHISSTMLDPFTGFIADKFGKRRAFIVGQIFWTATQYIYGFSTQMTGFVLAEGVAAIGNSLKSDALQSWLQNELGEQQSSKVMGRSRALFTVGQIIASILAGYITARFGMKLAWFLSGTLFLIATIIGSIVLSSTKTNDRQKKQEQRGEAMKISKVFTVIFANKRFVKAALLVATLGFAEKPVFMYWPQIITTLGVSEEMRGWFILAISLPTLLGSFLAGENKFLTRNTKGLSRLFIVFGIGLAISGFAKTLVVYLIGFILIEVAYGASRIIVYGYIYDEIKDEHRSTVNSIVSAARTGGGSISLLSMGALADATSPQTTLIVVGIFVFIVWIIVLRRTCEHNIR